MSDYLAHALLSSAEQVEPRATVQQALDRAQRVDDPVALCDPLRISGQIDRRPETTEARLAVVEAERLADAYDTYIYDPPELGNIDTVDAASAQQTRVAEEIRQPFQLHVANVFKAMSALLRGDFDAAERSANAAAAISSQPGIAALGGILGIHMFTIRAEQGRLHEVAPIVKLDARANPAPATWRPGLALDLDGRMGAPAWLAHDWVEYVAMWLAGGTAAEHPQAGRLLEGADRAARTMRMGYLCERIAGLQTEVGRTAN